MKTLYRPSDGIEAQLLVDLLESEGIDARIEGEYLQGGIGELPAGGLVRLTVDEADHARAREVIEHWEASRAHSTPTLKSPPRKLSSAYLVFLTGLAIGIGGSFLYFQSPTDVSGIDYNDDGLFDERTTYSPAGLALKTETDRNLDGKVDAIFRYDRRGLIKTSEADDDFDGTMETRLKYWRGNVETADADTDGDGRIDLRTRFVHGVVESVEYLDPASGQPRRVEHFHLGKLTRVEIDTNDDGQLDTREHYDSLSRKIDSETISR